MSSSDKGASAEEEGGAGEVGGDGQVEGGVVLAAGDAEEAEVVCHFVLDALPVEPVERDAGVVGLVEQGDGRSRCRASASGQASSKLGEVLAGFALDGGFAAAKLSGEGQRGASIVLVGSAICS